MRIAVGTAKVLFVALLFFLSTTILEDRYHGSFAPAGTYPYGAGNAPENIRSEVIDTLGLFQEGYAKRDTAVLEPFMTRLFSASNTVILGTMPQEICVGIERATGLVRADWEQWGNCVFDLENVHVSTHDDVAWFSTVGYVEFDLSSLLVLPLRLTGVLVREQGAWQFQHLQFQFDPDLTLVLVITVLLGVWLVVQIVALAVIVFRRLRRRSQVSVAEPTR